ncbi:hypothetical protein Nmel_013288 [Mimus melanotis]
MQRPREDSPAELQEGLGAYQALTPQEAADVLELLEEHEALLSNSTQLQLSEEHSAALRHADLSSPGAIGSCTAAARALSSCMALPIHPSDSQFSEGCESAAPPDPLKSQNIPFSPGGYRKLQAVAEQLILFETLKQNFENSFVNHITNIFELQGNSQAPALGTVAVPSHGPHHEELLPYTPLMSWLRNTNPNLFWDLPKVLQPFPGGPAGEFLMGSGSAQSHESPELPDFAPSGNVYSQNLGRLYEREIKALFEQAKLALLGRRKGRICHQRRAQGTSRGASLPRAPEPGTLCKEMEEAKAPSRMRGGILPCVNRFQEFLDCSEEVSRTSQRRGELDKAQLRMASSVFSSSECQGWLFWAGNVPLWRRE